MKKANDFYIDTGTMDELFAGQAKLETNVQLYNMIQSGGDPFKIQNLKALMGGENPTEKLTKLNNYIDLALSTYEGHIATDRSIIASNRVIVDKKRAEVIEMRNMQGKYDQQITQKKAEVQMLTIKLVEEQNVQQLKQSEYVNSLQQNKEFIESMTLSQRSFVLQKALLTSTDAIIELMTDVELNPDFRNGDGVSLVQTANEVGNQTIIEKLALIASPESSYPIEFTHNMQNMPNIGQFQPEHQQNIADIINEQIANLQTHEEHKVEDINTTGNASHLD